MSHTAVQRKLEVALFEQGVDKSGNEGITAPNTIYYFDISKVSCDVNGFAGREAGRSEIMSARGMRFAKRRDDDL